MPFAFPNEKEAIVEKDKSVTLRRISSACGRKLLGIGKNLNAYTESLSEDRVMANEEPSPTTVPNAIKVLVAVLALTCMNVFILPHGNGFATYDWFFFEGIFCLVLTPLCKRKDAAVLLSVGVIILVIYLILYF